MKHTFEKLLGHQATAETSPSWLFSISGLANGASTWVTNQNGTIQPDAVNTLMMSNE